MALLIAWQALNKIANPQDARFSDAFLIVTPGITIKDRLRVLLPNDPQNYYRQRDVLPTELMDDLGKVFSYVKNHNLGFAIPYTINGEERNYYPDFIARIKLPSRPSSSSTLVGEPLSFPSTLAGEGGGEGVINLI